MIRKISQLLILLVAFIQLNPQEVSYVDSLLLEQSKTHLVDEKISIFFRLSDHYNDISIDTSRLMIQQALGLALELGSDKHIANAYLKLGLLYVMTDSLEQASVNYKHSIMYYEKLDDFESVCDVLVILGNIYYVKGNYPKAMEHYNDALTLTQKINYVQKLPHCYNNLGVVYHSQKKYSKSLNYFTKALELFENNNDTLHVALTLGNIGSIYVNLDNLDIAKDYFTNALIEYDILNDKEGELLSILQVSEIHLKNNEPDSALSLINDAYSIYRKLPVGFRGPKVSRYSDIKIKTALSYMMKKEWGTSILHLDSCYYAANKARLNDVIRESSKLLSDIYDSIGITDSSYKYFKIYSYYSDSILNEDNIRNMAQMEFKYKYDQQIIEAELSEKEEQAAENRRTLILIIIVVCLFFALVIFILLLKLEKNKKTKINIERLRLKDELEYKNKELTTHMLYLLKKNEFILSISEKLKKIIPSIKVQNKKSIAEIINELTAGTSNDTWKEFEIRFQEVHTSFFDNLNLAHPDLSPNELRLCSFLRLNMSTKDISAITYQSISSIDMARFRLRKKIGIESNEHLVTYLSRL